MLPFGSCLAIARECRPIPLRPCASAQCNSTLSYVACLATAAGQDGMLVAIRTSVPMMLLYSNCLCCPHRPQMYCHHPALSVSM
jgi:hypothetical protein